MLTIDQALLLELDAHPDATAEDLHRYLRNQAPLNAIARWLRAHEGWLVIREAARWRLAPQGESFLAALD
jgi:hypothetical protein